MAGAAAGVAAIFKAPATGAIFALEVPYRDDMARRMLLPALVASATGYLTFVTLSDTDAAAVASAVRLPNFELIDLLGALLVGTTCAIGARGVRQDDADREGLLAAGAAGAARRQLGDARRSVRPSPRRADRPAAEPRRRLRGVPNWLFVENRHLACGC